MRIRKIRGGCASEVLNFDGKSAKLGDIQELKFHLHAQGVLVLRNQALSPGEYVRFARKFGVIEEFPTHSSMKRHPEIFPVSNLPEKGHIYEGRSWHTDSIDEDRPCPMTLFYSHVLPKKGGRTHFINTHHLYMSLSDRMKRKLEHLEAVYRSGHIHPLIQTHPVTGEKCLFIHFGLIFGIRRMDPNTYNRLLKFLQRKFESWSGIYRHSYRPGDLVIWDNAKMSHIAGGTDPKYPRIMYRITISGST
jgi:taurine dioxygenase